MFLEQFTSVRDVDGLNLILIDLCSSAHTTSQFQWRRV